MNEDPIIHPRIHERHPDITDDDVKAAWYSLMDFSRRKRSINRWIAVGLDGKGRSMELIFSMNSDGRWVIFHAYTPPTKGILKELGLI
ncbi:hypothetical protein OZX67_01715 [Bifidobacterium sp. ESL0728]|uniref:hypothetical protein n=1 Tax=Bifidobacterium sp. ESL0728 TaxID=2983220 RepID=UPI0023F894B5|nr:hypothetical protein [Bifidobacterium sp. ESL0728]WEV59311.1 hypothetical protein OZX67_01715 [Bifidobacterium sp. ESL0728]